MTDPAKAARENAISLEVKKDGLQQRQSGDWMLRVVFSASDYSEVLGRAPMGTRFACVLVEINDDETPFDHNAEQRDKWRDLGPVKQAGIRCKEPTFWAYLREQRGFRVHNEEDAAESVRALCQVGSRSDLNKPGYQRQRAEWHELDFAFQGWKARENA